MDRPLSVRYSVRDERWRDDQYLYIAELINNCRILSGDVERLLKEKRDLSKRLHGAEKQVAQLDAIAKELVAQGGGGIE
jgi:hypothetical protein